jgi:tetrahydromethanopterin S-methyltransferase subunit F
MLPGPNSVPPARDRGSDWNPLAEPEGRFSRGLSLAYKSWRVIRADRSLLVLPLLQIAFQAVAAAAVLTPIGDVAYQDSSRYVFLIGIAAVAFPLNFIATFFGVAFVFVLRGHLDGRKVSLREGLRFAYARIDAITGWALLTTAVGLAVQALERVRGGAIAARIAGWIVGVAWAVAALFAIPALATEGIGPISAARKSASVVKQKWPEGVIGTTAIGLATGFWFIPVVIVGLIGWTTFSHAPTLGATLLAIAVGGFLLLNAIQSAVDGVFRLALYDFAANDTVHAPFTESDLAGGLKGKKRRRWFGSD